ncbi:MAG: GNAT family N-acetyltransferase [Qingshengfaniella sp.]
MIRIRPYRPTDAPELSDLFHRAVHEGAARFYTAAERTAWAPPDAPGPDWADRLGAEITLVAETTHLAPAGFMTLGRDGHLDLAYVHPQAMVTGVAAALHDRMLGIARDLGHTRLDTEASHLARRFFLRQGWTDHGAQQVIRHGVTLTNFRMEKRLA